MTNIMKIKRNNTLSGKLRQMVVGDEATIFGYTGASLRTVCYVLKAEGYQYRVNKDKNCSNYKVTRIA